MSTAATASKIYFSTFQVSSQVFHLTPLSYALVNLKPLLPGHVLVCPRRVVPRLKDLTKAEVADLFSTVQDVGRMLEDTFGAEGLNVAVQDGPVAGQSVPHVHTHIIPRHAKDLPEDEIYKMLESEDADIGRVMRGVLEKKSEVSAGRGLVVKPDAERKPRTEEEMKKEAEWLRGRMKELELASE